MEPISRASARVVPCNAEGEVLLLQEVDPSRPDAPRWCSIGGAVEPGESVTSAALRELFEETGIRASAADLLGPVWCHRNEYTYDGVHYRGEHTVFAIGLDRDVEVSFEHLAPDEIDTVLAARWWGVEELRATAAFVPPDLPDIITRVLTTWKEVR